FFVKQTPRMLGVRYALETPDMHEEISWDPLGLVINISAWNYPWFVGSNVFLPALLTGNAVLYKPSEFASMTGQRIAELLWEAGIPQEVFVPIIGGGHVGAQLLQEEADGVFFTGSYTTGRAIAKALSGRFVHLQLELGGKDPAYICDDVDVAKAAAGVADGAFYNAGQSCCAVERIYVHDTIHDAFIDHLQSAIEALVVGDPTDPDTTLGPLTREPQIAILKAQVQDALDRGATLHCGGKRLDRPGYYFAPTLLTNVDHSMAVMRDETFGPVIGVQRVSDDETAIALMNDTPYGLTSGVYTRSESRARTILGRMKSGSVYWNCCDRVSPRLPWSGRGHSGMGLTLSTEGIRAFTRPRAWHMRPA
ncbi:MAG: aldehyde dehydrogenase family protein, partial [Myxococcota bacterium]